MRLLKPAQRRARALASHAYPLPHSYVAGGTKDAYPILMPAYMYLCVPSCAESWRCGKCADTYVRSLRVRLLGFAAMRTAPIFELVVTNMHML